MKGSRFTYLLAAAVSLALFTGTSQAGFLASAAARAVAKKSAAELSLGVTEKAAATAARKAQLRRLANSYKRDMARDARTVAKPLARGRLVHRYTSAKQARIESARGLSRGVHTTSVAVKGRPLSRERAQARFGLQRTPTVRTTWSLDAGTKVKKNKALGGGAGVGELRMTQRIPPERRVGGPVKLKRRGGGAELPRGGG